MIRSLRRIFAPAAAAAVWFVGKPSAVPGVSFELAGPERQEAIRLGEACKERADFASEWTVIAEGGHRVTVATPFYFIVSTARDAALKSEKLRTETIDNALKPIQGKLVLRVNMRVGHPEAARHFMPELTDSRGKQLKETGAINELWMRQRDADGRFTAHCVYRYSSTDIEPNGRYTLVVCDEEDKSIRARFVIDLSKMR